MSSEPQRKNEEEGRRSVSLTQAVNSDSQTIDSLTQGGSHVSERLLEIKLPLQWDESVTACHVQGITADYPMFYSGFKNYEDILLFQLQKQAPKG